MILSNFRWRLFQAWRATSRRGKPWPVASAGFTAVVDLHAPEPRICTQICSKKQQATISVLPIEVNSAPGRAGSGDGGPGAGRAGGFRAAKATPAY